MAYTSEIEKLEKRWAENPKGRNFAPLADAYRKAGELDRAIELCKAGLERHPDYVSAHIVYGRCLMDQKNDAGASDVFRKVLTLDPENVLGLKILAEIAERGKRYGEAVEWLTRLLSADPMNGDAADSLARAKGKAAQAAPPAPAAAAPPAPPAAPAPPPAHAAPAASGPRPVTTAKTTPPPAIHAAPPAPPPPAPPARASRAAPAAEPVVRLVPEEKTAPLAKPDFRVEHVSEEPSAPDASVAGRRADIETFDGTLDLDSAAHDAAKAEGLEVQEDVVLTPQNMEVEGLAHTQYESGLFVPPPEAAPPEDDLPTIDLPLIMPDDVAPARAASVGGGAAGTGGPPAAVSLSDDDGAADTAALSRAEPVLTETMAELYLKQGHQEDALRVYQALLAQRPGDARLRARLDALSPGGKREAGRGRERGTGESLPTFLKRILGGRPYAAAPEPAPPPAPPEAAGESPLASAFAIASNQPEPEPSSISPGEATRPAEDSISLDAVFGEEGLRAGEPAAEPPASAPSAPQQTGGFSFDQFFSATAAGGSPTGGAAQPPARPSGGSPKPGAPVEDEGELDQFQSWLRGLKS